MLRCALVTQPSYGNIFCFKPLILTTLISLILTSHVQSDVNEQILLYFFLNGNKPRRLFFHTNSNLIIKHSVLRMFHSLLRDMTVRLEAFKNHYFKARILHVGNDYPNK